MFVFDQNRQQPPSQVRRTSSRLTGKEDKEVQLRKESTPPFVNIQSDPYVWLLTFVFLWLGTFVPHSFSLPHAICFRTHPVRNQSYDVCLYIFK
jgi:hypothetical protein